MTDTPQTPEFTQHIGSCHCGDVTFTFKSRPSVNVTQCNCSVCNMTGYQHVFIPEADLTFLTGQNNLALYTFGSHKAQHYFCKTCGVKPLYTPKSHPEAWSVNLRCVQDNTLSVTKIIEFDGQNWEENIKSLCTQT